MNEVVVVGTAISVENATSTVTGQRPLFALDEDGNRVVYSFEEREQSEQQARAEVARWCQ